MTIPVLTAHDWFTITGRGQVAAVHMPSQPVDVVSVGDWVRFDDRPDKTYAVTGVETYRILTYPPTTGDNVGLLVKEVAS